MGLTSVKQSDRLTVVTEVTEATEVTVATDGTRVWAYRVSAVLRSGLASGLGVG